MELERAKVEQDRLLAEQKAKQAAEQKQAETGRAEQARAEQARAEQAQMGQALQLAFKCPNCDYVGPTQKALNGHQLKHTAKGIRSNNGNGHQAQSEIAQQGGPREAQS
jgi:hypothetical protein